MTHFTYRMPVEVVFGAGAVARLGEACAPLGGRALLVTGRHSARACGALDRALAQLPGAVVFDAVEPNPSTDTCERAAQTGREHGCDVVVAIGGGSPMDVAKAAAVLMRNEGPCGAYFGADRYVSAPAPVVAVPTTAGTGSEVTPYAVITDRREQAKRTISGRDLFPRVALLDPDLTRGLPASVTADTGLDVLSQAMEGVVSKRATPWTTALALEACRLVRRWLGRAVAHGEDGEARGGMLYASCLAGCVIAHTGTTLVHGLGYYYTLECGVPHGRANGLLLAPLFAWNARHAPEAVSAVSEALGHPCRPEPEAAARAVVGAIQGVLRDAGVPTAARDAGVDASRLGAWAEHVCGDPYRFRNQPGTITPGDVRAFLEASWSGEVAGLA